MHHKSLHGTGLRQQITHSGLPVSRQAQLPAKYLVKGIVLQWCFTALKTNTKIFSLASWTISYSPLISTCFYYPTSLPGLAELFPLWSLKHTLSYTSLNTCHICSWFISQCSPLSPLLSSRSKMSSLAFFREL